MTEELIGQLGYVGIALILVLGGLGLPIPEEAPIILAAVLTRNGQMSGPVAIATCLVGVLLGDFVVYFLGFFYGEKVLSLPLTRRLLTRQREAQIKGYFHRHGFKILVSGRFVPGFRTAAYLTAGILKLPPLKLLLTDLVAASLSTSLMFGLGWLFAHRIQKGIRDVQQWLTLLAALGVGGFLLYRYYRAQRAPGFGLARRSWRPTKSRSLRWNSIGKHPPGTRAPTRRRRIPPRPNPARPPPRSPPRRRAGSLPQERPSPRAAPSLRPRPPGRMSRSGSV